MREKNKMQDSKFDWFISLPSWVLFVIVVATALAGWAVYGRGIFDNVQWFAYYTGFNLLATIVLKWIIALSLMIVGALAMLILFVRARE
jgi:hypothetical protein